MSDVYGIQAVRAVLAQSAERARCLYMLRGRRDARINELIGLARAAQVRHQAVDGAWFRRRAGDGAHQGVLLECHEVALADEATLLAALPDMGPDPLLLVLDEVTDPRNLGACLRTANAAGVQAVVLPKRNSAPLSAVAMKTAQGGVEGLMIAEVTNLARTLKALQAAGLWTVGADAEADLLYSDADLTGGRVVIMGSEGQGLRRLTREHCDYLVRIPMHGAVNSLNVSVATGVVLFEARRQRLALGQQAP